MTTRVDGSPIEGTVRRSAWSRIVAMAAVVLTSGILIPATASAHSASADASTESLRSGVHDTLEAKGRAPFHPPATVVGDAPSGEVGPAQSSILGAAAYGLAHPDAVPLGANDWSCHPSAEHPVPVVLVHGTYLDAYMSGAGLSPALSSLGYCVFALTYGTDLTSAVTLIDSVNATGDIRVASAQLARFVDRVLAATGASQVDLIGHSQGGLVGRHYITMDGGSDPDPERNKVRTLVSLAGSYHGTAFGGIAPLVRYLQGLGLRTMDATQLLLGTATEQQLVGSEFLRRLDERGDTMPGVHYVGIKTRFDEVVNPYESQTITAGPGAVVENHTLQDGCESDTSEHGSIVYNRRALHIALRAMGDPRFQGPPPCDPSLLLSSLTPLR